MHTSPFDFVSALSAEELCPVCRELHAAVDECLCVFCETHVCLDCSSLQPDTTWICKPCAAAIPGRAYPIVSPRPAWAQVQHARHAVREQLVLWAREAGPAYARLVALLQTTLVSLIEWSRSRARPALLRSLAQGRAATQQLSRALQAECVRCARWLSAQRRLAPLALAWFRRSAASGVQLARSLPVREHATSLLIAAMILTAVARAENGPDAS